MSGWFRAKAECPVDAVTREWLEKRWAWLEEQFGRDRVQTTTVVLPTPEFFPDAYAGSADDARVMFDRICRHMDIAPQTVEMSLYQDAVPAMEDGFVFGTSGLYHEEADKYRIWIEAANLADPLAMVATMAHELGHVLLLGQKRLTREQEDHEPLTDLLTVFFGLGVFTANSVVHSKNWHYGNMEGWSIGRRGYLDMRTYGYALALFARARGEDRPDWVRHLRPDVRLAFKHASRFLAAGREIETLIASGDEDEPSPTPAAEEPEEAEDEVVEETDGRLTAAIDRTTLLRRYASGERDFRRLKLQGLSLHGANLQGSSFCGADLFEADLTCANLSNADLRDADVQDATLQGVNLRDCNLSNADFSGADLSTADLTRADIRGTNFSGAKLDRTILVGTRRDQCTNLAKEDLSTVVCDSDVSREELYGTLDSDELTNLESVVARYAIIGVIVAFPVGLIAGAIAGAAVELFTRDRQLRDWLSLVVALGVGFAVLAKMARRPKKQH